MDYIAENVYHFGSGHTYLVHDILSNDWLLFFEDKKSFLFTKIVSMHVCKTEDTLHMILYENNKETYSLIKLIKDEKYEHDFIMLDFASWLKDIVIPDPKTSVDLKRSLEQNQ